MLAFGRNGARSVFQTAVTRLRHVYVLATSRHKEKTIRAFTRCSARSGSERG